MATTENPATSVASTRSKPFTGQEYLERLKDGREIWIYGERVKDVTTHPAFRNTARMLARLYDALHDPKHHDTLCTPTETGNGGYTRITDRFEMPRISHAQWLATKRCNRD